MRARHSEDLDVLLLDGRDGAVAARAQLRVEVPLQLALLPRRHLESAGACHLGVGPAAGHDFSDDFVHVGWLKTRFPTVVWVDARALCARAEKVGEPLRSEFFHGGIRLCRGPLGQQLTPIQ